MSLTPEQRRVKNTLIRVGRRKGATRKEILAALATGLVEANLTNPHGGDGTSVGWRQETSGSYGGKNRMDVAAAAGRFYNEVKAHRGEGLSVGQLAQAVQRSAFPGRYQTKVGEARRLLGQGDTGRGDLLFPGTTIKGGSYTTMDPQAFANAVLTGGGKNPLLAAQEQATAGAFDVTHKAPDTKFGAVYDRPQESAGPGNVKVASGANRAGVPLRPIVKRLVGQIAGQAGRTLTITTGTNHKQMTTSGNVSDHWDGHGADIAFGNGGNGKIDPRLTRLGQAALIAAGVPPAKARKMKGGAYTVNWHGHRVQIIFNSFTGGDHYNHLHVGVR